MGSHGHLRSQTGKATPAMQLTSVSASSLLKHIVALQGIPLVHRLPAAEACIAWGKFLSQVLQKEDTF